MSNKLPDFVTGELILINKPIEWTSFDAVNKLKCSLNIKKIGHAGTLDPLATGLVIICTGKKTKQIDTYQNLKKEYTGTFYLGKSTPSLDGETEVNETASIDHVTDELIKETLLFFMGPIQQTPPLFSAIKINGERLYKKAHLGHDEKDFEIKSREITIYEFEITKIDLPSIDFKIVCSKGTYIRSLARDFGKKLGTCAYLTKLCRTKIGDISLDDAQTPQEFIDKTRKVIADSLKNEGI